MTTVVENETYKLTEGSTPTYSVTLVDENDQPIASADMLTITMTVKDDFTDAVINTREDQDVLDNNDCTLGATDGLFTWNLKTLDTVVVDQNLRFEIHSVVITWTWDDGGVTKQQRHLFYIQMENLGRSCWQNYVSRIALRIGAGRRILEMTDDHWCEAAQQSIDLINTYIFRPIYVNLGEISTENTVVRFNDQTNFPDDYDINLRAVARVMFRPTSGVGATALGDDPFLLSSRIVGGSFWGGYGGRQGGMAPAGTFGFGDIFFWMQHEEAVNRVSGNDPDWLWDEANRQLAISTPTCGPYDITYIKAYSYTPANLPKGYMNYFLKGFEGYARIMLGNIRGKYSQIPGPTGSTDTDAQYQIQRGEALIQEIETTFQRMPLMATPEFG